MLKLTKVTILLISILLANVTFAQFNPKLCNLHLSDVITLEGSRSLDDLDSIKLGTINMQDMDYFKHSNPFKKPIEKIQILADAINSEKLDLVVLQEIGTTDVLDAFNAKFLKSRYQAIFIEGSDKYKGIAFLVKKDLPLKMTIETFASQRSFNKILKKDIPLFSRDLPALHIRYEETSMNDPPDLILLGTHYKSQRTFKNDIRSVKRRTEQVDATVDIVKMYEQQYPETGIILAGDFNADIASANEFDSLFEGNRFTDTFDLNEKKVSSNDRITHTFHQKGKETNYNQLDAILVTQNLKDKIKNTKVYRYKDNNGITKPIPNTYFDRELNPSDHYPVVTEFDLKRIIKDK